VPDLPMRAPLGTLPESPPEATDLADYGYRLLRRWRLILVVFLLITSLAALRALLTRPVYQATAQILIERDNPKVLGFQQITEEKGYGIDDYYQTQYKLLQSHSLARRVLISAGLLGDPEFGGPRTPQAIQALTTAPEGSLPEMEALLSGFLARLNISPLRNSRLVNVSFEAHQPELAVTVVNAVLAAYMQQTVDLRYHTSSQAGVWLSGQIENQRKTVEALNVKLNQIQEQQGLVNIEERRTLLDQRLKELGTALNERKTERLQKEALWRQMAGAGNPEELPEVMRSGVLQSLRIELASLERQQAQVLERYMEQHPEVVKVRRQIEETRTKMRAEAQSVIRAAENDFRAAAAQEDSIASALEAAKAEALSLSGRATVYDSQKRELDAAKQVLDSLLARAKETDVTQELKATNIYIVDRASVPLAPVRPRPLRDILMGSLVGAFLSIGLAFFLEHLDNTVKTPEDVRKRLGAPLLGVVPEVRTARKPVDVLVSGPGTPPQQLIESYRVVRTALKYSWPETASRIILVTSAEGGEGKTLTSVNLALTLAAVGDPVILVDADLRLPKTHAALGVQRKPGLSDVLVGSATPSDAIRRISPGAMSVLPAGTSVPSPPDLLSTKALTGLLEELRGAYRWIVIDSPPVGAVVEPLILAPLADGVVFVAAAEIVSYKAALVALERIEDTGARILGVVLNRAQTERHAYYYRHYYDQYTSRYYGKRSSSGAPKETT
jgi:capsular exopolysaccharide synthesis family protein